MLKTLIQPRRKIRRERGAVCIISPNERHPSGTQLLDAIQHEIGVSQTYLTIARLAYDMGQKGRGDRSIARALEAHGDAVRMVALLPAPPPSILLTALDTIKDSLIATNPDSPGFTPPVRQPSMS
jgi:hypothetical protein